MQVTQHCTIFHNTIFMYLTLDKMFPNELILNLIPYILNQPRISESSFSLMQKAKQNITQEQPTYLLECFWCELRVVT